jgi:signal transduction histidine kinase/ligand-binding sensor protein
VVYKDGSRRDRTACEVARSIIWWKRMKDMTTTTFDEIIDNPRIFKVILDGVLHDWPGSYDIMPVESPQDRTIREHEHKFAEFCQRIRESKNGLQRCMNCDLEFSQIAAKNGKPLYYSCHAGLMEIAVPIVVGEKLIATIFCGQHRSLDDEIEKNAIQKTIQTEIDLGLNHGELLLLREKTYALSLNSIKDIEEKLWDVATYVSNLGLRKLEAEQAKRELSIRLRETDAIQRILLELSEVLEDIDAFWRKLDLVLEKLCEIIGADFGLFATCKSNSLRSDHKGLVRSVANLPSNLLENYLSCNLMISKALSQMKPTVEEFSHAQFSGDLIDQIKIHLLHSGTSKVAVVPIKLEPENEGIMLFFISENKDTEKGLRIEDEITLLTQTGTQIATSYGNCLLYQKQKELAEIQNDWLEDVSHQILAPITGILGQAENLSRSFKTWKNTNPQRIENTLENLVELSNWATRMARNFAWAAKGKSNHFNMNMMLEEDVPGRLIGYARNVQGLARTSDVYKVHVDSDSVKQLNGKIVIDNKLFKQAVTNLLDNAVKYADPKTNVVIDAEMSQQYGYIKITNYGIPILESEVEKIFLRHFRTETAKKKYSVGSGIGLGIAREIMRFHSGDLTVSPSVKLEKGWKTTFVISLPLVGSKGD